MLWGCVEAEVMDLWLCLVVVVGTSVVPVAWERRVGEAGLARERGRESFVETRGGWSEVAEGGSGLTFEEAELDCRLWPGARPLKLIKDLGVEQASCRRCTVSAVVAVVAVAVAAVVAVAVAAVVAVAVAAVVAGLAGFPGTCRACRPAGVVEYPED